MFKNYPFTVPLLIAWLPLFALTIVIFHTSWGISTRPVLNRVAYKKILSLFLFIAVLILMASGLFQLSAVTQVIFGQPLRYWHALAGFTFILLAALHLTIHIRDIIRYVFPMKPKTPPAAPTV